MLKKIILGLIAILILIIGGGFVYFLHQISRPVSDISSEKIFVVESGQGMKEISRNLETEGLISDSFIFEIYLWLKNLDDKLQAGDYSLKQNLNIIEVVRILSQGEVMPNEEVIKIIEGWQAKEIGAYLAEKGIVSQEDFSAAVNTQDSRILIPNKVYEFLRDKPSTAGLEGYLFPDTYRIYKDSKAKDIIEKMLDNFDKKFSSDFREEIASQDKTIYEIVTLASILEKEVRTDSDRKIAAGIFYDRLTQGIPLESDATVNYVTGKNVLQPSLGDINIESPYNTYLNKGLPPGPICNPGFSAIKAAIYPQDSEYFYFLTKPDGSTVFSKTYEEHLANKRKYLE